MKLTKTAEMEALLFASGDPLTLERAAGALFITQDVLDLLDGVDLLTIDVGDDITRLQAAGPARAGRTAVRLHRRQAHHQHAVGKQLDSHRPAQGDHLVPHLGA